MGMIMKSTWKVSMKTECTHTYKANVAVMEGIRKAAPWLVGLTDPRRGIYKCFPDMPKKSFGLGMKKLVLPLHSGEIPSKPLN